MVSPRADLACTCSGNAVPHSRTFEMYRHVMDFSEKFMLGVGLAVTLALMGTMLIYYYSAVLCTCTLPRALLPSVWRFSEACLA